MEKSGRSHFYRPSPGYRDCFDFYRSVVAGLLFTRLTNTPPPFPLPGLIFLLKMQLLYLSLPQIIIRFICGFSNQFLYRRELTLYRTFAHNNLI
jgi:hypothetical protein